VLQMIVSRLELIGCFAVENVSAAVKMMLCCSHMHLEGTAEDNLNPIDSLIR